jgi:hypothetical protein
MFLYSQASLPEVEVAVIKPLRTACEKCFGSG